MEFDQLVEAHQAPVFSYLKKIVRDHQHAEDLCQETFLRALRVLRRGEFPPHARPWLLRVAKNLAFDASRRRELVIHDSEAIESVAAAPAGPGAREAAAHSEEALERDMRQLLREGLGQLPAPDREILSRRYQDGMPYWEIGARRGLNPQAAKMRLFRGKRKLRKFINSRMRHPQSFVVNQAI